MEKGLFIIQITRYSKANLLEDVDTVSGNSMIKMEGYRWRPNGIMIRLKEMQKFTTKTVTIMSAKSRMIRKMARELIVSLMVPFTKGSFKTIASADNAQSFSITATLIMAKSLMESLQGSVNTFSNNKIFSTTVIGREGSRMEKGHISINLS